MSRIRTALALVMTAIVGSAVAGSAALAAPTPAAAGIQPGTVELSLGLGESAAFATRVTTPEVAPNPDIVFLADTTGSMLPALANVRNNGRTIMDAVLAAEPDARFGVAEYKEERNGPQVFRVHTPITNEQDFVQVGMQRWIDTAGGGGDPHTDFINAHYRIATDAFAFRPNGSRIVAWFGDARSHDPSLGHTLQDANAWLRSEGIRVVAVPVAGTTGGGLDALGQATSITNATDGVLMPDRSTDQVAQALLDGIRALTVAVTPRIGSCDAALGVGFSPASRTVRSGTDAEFVTSVAVRSDAAPGTYRCSVEYLVNGVSMGLVQSIVVTSGPDTTPPQITASVNPATPDGANGWYVSAPTVSFQCSDASGIASCTPPVTLGSSAQPQTVTGTAVDTAGNTASTSVDGLRVDLVDPTLACGSTPTFVVGEPGRVTATVSDAHSGPATPSASAPADTSTAGSRTARITGADVAGRTGGIDCPYQVGRVPSTLVAHPATLGTRPLLQFTLSPRATLTRTGTGAPLAGQPITFSAGGRQVCTATTDATGRASCTGPVDLLAVLLGGYTATFAGSATVEPATARGRLG